MSEKGPERAPTTNDAGPALELTHGGETPAVRDTLTMSTLPIESAEALFITDRELVGTYADVESDVPVESRQGTRTAARTKVEDLDEDELDEEIKKNGEGLKGYRKYFRLVGLGLIPVSVVIGNLTPVIPVGLVGVTVGLIFLIKAVGIEKAMHDLQLAKRKTLIGMRNFSVGAFGEELVETTEKYILHPVGKAGNAIGKFIATITFAKIWAPRARNLLKRIFPDKNGNYDSENKEEESTPKTT